ncbi:unnamed protein product [Macrosiphum euphorbiae]|uniref:THAP-type domain-containing protein n=1 Tax=Macrosiphum euphorbiae TaxID=13131 RepID=A0AAV0VRZ0_9HEMI|nr:unnamed protein product [Macrosiphum euphorbiae]
MRAIKLRMGKETLKKKNLRVCSKHFTENDFFSQSAMNKKRRLLMTAIPTQTLPVSSVHNTSPKKDLVLRTEKKVTYIQHKKQNVRHLQIMPAQ